MKSVGMWLCVIGVVVRLECLKKVWVGGWGGGEGEDEGEGWGVGRAF